jgi:succinylarginine dihydrolase
MREVNFDGLIGPTHNFAGLSLGNIASASNANMVSRPRAAALQGLDKMRFLMTLGIDQGIFLPHVRPCTRWLRSLGFAGDDASVCSAAWTADPALLSNATSASAMWTANAATVSPAPDTRDGRCHLTTANLATMAHRSLEASETADQLRRIFHDQRYFAVHGPVPHNFGDEGAANFMRLAPTHGTKGVEIFVYGEDVGGRFPARQSRLASEAVARQHGIDPDSALFVRQTHAAIQAGAFHNDVVAVANEHVLFAHEQAFEDSARLYDFIVRHMPDATIIEVPADRVSLEDSVTSYLFNSQIVTLEDGEMALILPNEARESPRVWSWLNDNIVGKTPITSLVIVDVRESMQNGGGPACLRLRVAVDDLAFAAIDRRFILDERKWTALYRLIESHWPNECKADDLGNPDFWAQAEVAYLALLRQIDCSRF